MKPAIFYICLFLALILLMRLLDLDGGTNVGVIASVLVLIHLGYQFRKK